MMIWLCRVLLHPGPVRKQMKLSDLSARSHETVLAKVVNGELGTLPDGCIIEPVQSYATEVDATAARERAMVDSPNEDWRVVISMPVAAK